VIALLLAVMMREAPARVAAPPLRKAAVRVDEIPAADAVVPFPERDALLLQRGDAISLVPLDRAGAEQIYAGTPRGHRLFRAFTADGRAFLAFNPPMIRDVARGTGLDLGSSGAITQIVLDPAQKAAIVAVNDTMTWWRPGDGAHRTLPAGWKLRQFTHDGAWLLFDDEPRTVVLDMASGNVLEDAVVDERFDAVDVAWPQPVRYRCTNDNPCGYRIDGKRMRAPVEELDRAVVNDGHVMLLAMDQAYWMTGPDGAAKRIAGHTAVDRFVLLGRGRAVVIADRDELLLYDFATHSEWSAFDGLPHVVIPDSAPPESRHRARFVRIIATARDAALLRIGEGRPLSARETLPPGSPPLEVATTMLVTSSGERWQLHLDVGTSRDVFLHDSGNFAIAELLRDGRRSLRRVIVERR
jgi:hypothetical protein